MGDTFEVKEVVSGVSDEFKVLVIGSNISKYVKLLEGIFNSNI